MSQSARTATLGELAELVDGQLLGDATVTVSGVSTLQDATPDQVAALTSRQYRGDLKATSAGCVILATEAEDMTSSNRILHTNPGLAFAKIATYFHPPGKAKPGVAESARIAAGVVLANDVEIADGCVIESNVVIGPGVRIGPGCVLMEGVHLGAGSRLVANVTLCGGVQIGQRCLVHPGAVIGSDGFGFANDKGAWIKVPQVGHVVIGDDVEIGANTTIDRGSLRDTRIGDGVKLDNQIQIAHNVEIGKHTAIAALVGIAGSTTIGSYCTIGGEAGVVGHLEIGDRCHIAAQTLVTRSLPDGSHYSGGVPAVETGLWRRMIARLRHLDELFERVRVLEKRHDNSR